MRVVFMGTSGFAVPILSALARQHQIAAVITQPDRPSGRGRQTSESPVKLEAMRLGLLVYQPERVKEESFVQQLRDLGPLDVIVVAAFGQIIPKSILDMPRLGCVNVHASLLPKYRGAAPIQHALIEGETLTGVTTMLMDPGLDTGPVLLIEELEIDEDETAGELEKRLSELGAELLLRTLDDLESSSLTPIPQDDLKATLARSFKREDAAIDWNLPANRVVNKIRAFTPRPGSYTFLDDVTVKVWKAVAVADTERSIPGTVLKVSDDGILVAAGEGAALLTEVQPENRKRMSASDFARGIHLSPGAILGRT